MLKNLKLIIIIIAILTVASAFVTANLLLKKNKELKSENARLQTNNFNLFNSNNKNLVLYLKEHEISSKLHAERDSLSKALKVKPKFINKIVYETITEKDTVVRNVYVFQTAYNSWNISDTGKCFTWSGTATLIKDSLHVQRSGFSYDNKITEVYYRKRPKSFLGIKYGKRQNFVQKDADCGTVSTKEFNFIK